MDQHFPNITYRRGAAGSPIPIVKGTGIRVQTPVVSHQDWHETASQIAGQ